MTGHQKEYFIYNVEGKTDATLLITENGSYDVLDYDTVEVDVYVEPTDYIATIAGINFKYCISIYECTTASNMVTRLPSKEFIPWTSGMRAPYIHYVRHSDLEYYYDLYISTTEKVTLDTTNGLIYFSGDFAITHAYVLHNDRTWVLFYNLAES